MQRDSGLVLIACDLAIFAVGENSTAIMAALPNMSAELGLGAAAIEWAVNAYLLASAAFIILGGRVADGVGARRSAAAGIRCRLRRGRYAGRRRASGTRRGARGGHQRLDRIPDAGLQHRSPARRR